MFLFLGSTFFYIYATIIYLVDFAIQLSSIKVNEVL